MKVLIDRLVKSGHAYVAEGHVLYNVSSKSDYGKLARRSLDEMIAGARVEVAPYKRNPTDFVLAPGRYDDRYRDLYEGVERLQPEGRVGLVRAD